MVALWGGGDRAYGRRTKYLITTIALLCGLALPPAAVAYAPQLTRYPYLTDVVGTSATVNWATDRSRTSGRVRYGREGVESCSARAVTATRSSITVNGVAEYQWRATVGGLAPGARYCYRPEFGTVTPRIDLLDTDPSISFDAQLPAGATAPFSFAVLGDFGAVGTTEAGADNRQADVMTQIARSGVRFVVGTGDTAYPSGSQTNYGDLRQTGSNVSTIFGPQFWPKFGASTPFFNATGNHGLTSTFLNNWPQPTAASDPGERYAMETYCCPNGTNSASYPSAWYAFDVGVARFYVLDAAWTESNVGTADQYKNDYDTHWTPTSPEYQWLAKDLQANPSQLKFAFFHYPIYSSNATEASDPWLRGADSLEGLLARNGVAIGFSGHAHNYTRSAKPEGGIYTYVTGGGGARLQPATRCGAPVAYAIGWSYSTGGSACGTLRPTSIDQVFHFLKVTVDGFKVTVAPTDSQGRTFDVRTYDFGDGAPPPPPPPPPPGPVALVREATAGAPTAASSLTIPIASGAGHALVAAIAVQAGTTTSVSSVTDSAGNAWTKGPIGFLSGSNTRVEIWHATAAAPVSQVTVNLSAADIVSANVSEWSGLATAQPVDALAGQGNASATTAQTPAITTANANDLIVGAINFPRTVSSTLTTPDFARLDDFTASTVSGRAAYRVVTATGTYSLSWTLSGASTSGGAILALKGAPP
jgi:Purple acid Phosphatase, N-terminal domain/Calcineurin-like phosphoesterase